MMGAIADIVACGLACPVGLSARPAMAAIYAGISRFECSETVRDAAGDAARASRLRALSTTSPRAERALHFAKPALAEALGPIAHALSAPIPCFVAVPAELEGDALELTRLVRELERSTTAEWPWVRFDWHPVRFGSGGRAAGFRALHEATAALSRAPNGLLLMGAFDSLCSDASLKALARHNQLLGASNPDGVIPGEGAAFVALGAPSAGGPVGSVLARLSCCATAAALDGASPFAAALTQVFQELWTQDPRRVAAVLSAHFDQATSGRSFSYAYLRCAQLMPEPLNWTRLGSSLGDAGAAAGALALAAAVMGLRPLTSLRAARHTSALVYAEADDAAAGGCVVRQLVQAREGH